MLHITTVPAERRVKFRARLASGKPLQFQIAHATNLPTLTDVEYRRGEPQTRSPMMLQHRGDMELK